jgi:acyl-[acyl carrier protein]--UDP-N-acetylglucosamine O-acyltransferase
MNASVHQKSIIGKYCMIGGSSFFKGESPDGIVWGGVPATPLKVNTFGIERSTMTDEEKISMTKAAEKFIDIFKTSRNV